MLEQVRQIERRKRCLSTDSVVSLSFLDSLSRRRARSSSVERDCGDPKQSRLANSQPAMS